jgi:hypothetical protein
MDELLQEKTYYCKPTLGLISRVNLYQDLSINL